MIIRSICVPFDSEEHYAACATDLESFRQHRTEVFAKHPALFPAGISEGFVLQVVYLYAADNSIGPRIG